MKNSTLVLMAMLAVGAISAVANGQEGLPVAEGIAYVTPVQDGSCLAVKVPVSEVQAVSGFKWFNGSDDQAFSLAMVGSGAGEFPPPLAEAVGLATDLQGAREAWSEVAFSEPVASDSGSLFLIMQYPDGYAVPDSGLQMGVGYVGKEGQGCYFVSCDGAEWIKVASRCQLLVEPVYCERDSTMLSKSMEAAEDTPIIPREFGVQSYPNPFNPVTTIEVALPKPTECSIEIYDIRGRLVRDLYSGRQVAGYAKFAWDGQDNAGRGVGSGVYFAMVRTENNAMSRRLVLIK